MPKKTDYITETRLCIFLGITEDARSDKIKNLRQKHQFPFIKIGKSNFLYYLPDVFKWLNDRKVVLGSETENESG